ncbi:MAG: hypothetical protein KBT36_08555 [Kurthia sp.]|nr:hypothetical protein [Candidatus Kurthia equi]
MFGSLYYNFWLALAGFTIYFFARFQTNQAPISVILFGLMWATIAFVVAFILRGIIGYILYTPEPEVVEDELLEDGTGRQPEQQIDTVVDESKRPSQEQSEEIAQVVQTMLQQDNK